MKRLLLPAVLAALMIAEVHAESFTISDIRVNGLQRVSAGSLFGALPLNVGEQADDNRLVEATRSLFKTGFFQDIQLGREGDVLVINVVERPSISGIEIEGKEAYEIFPYNFPGLQPFIACLTDRMPDLDRIYIVTLDDKVYGVCRSILGDKPTIIYNA